jgi:hypothetical protein
MINKESSIQSEAELVATLDYIAKWADTLEGMRRHELEQNTHSDSVFLTLVAGPLQEIRTNLEAARAFAHAELESQSTTIVTTAPLRLMANRV